MRTALALAATLLASSPALSQETLRYATSIGGLPLGSLDLATRIEGGGYGVQASFRMVPLLRQILNGDAKATAQGAVDAGRYTPQTALFRYDSSDGERRLAMAFDERGHPIDLRVDPPLRKRSYDMTLGDAAGAVDPATAIAIMMAPRENPCTLSFDVFDGAKRHRISLTDTLGVERGVVTCAGMYERIKGFKAKYMTPERRTYPFRAELARQGQKWVPLKISSQTKFGPASVRLKR